MGAARQPCVLQAEKSRADMFTRCKASSFVNERGWLSSFVLPQIYPCISVLKGKNREVNRQFFESDPEIAEFCPKYRICVLVTGN
jgi:hypothetical protein